MRKINKKTIYLGLTILVLVILSIGLYFYIQYKRLQAEIVIPSTTSNQKPLLQRVSDLTNLPQGEEPEYVRITDINKAKNQPFLVGAKNGDIILLYKKAKLAVLYDPVANRIIQTGPLVLATGAANLNSK